MGSRYIRRVDRVRARARLLAAARDEVVRLEAAARAGWDVAVDLARARASVAAFS